MALLFYRGFPLTPKCPSSFSSDRLGSGTYRKSGMKLNEAVTVYTSRLYIIPIIPLHHKSRLSSATVSFTPNRQHFLSQLDPPCHPPLLVEYKRSVPAFGSICIQTPRRRSLGLRGASGIQLGDSENRADTLPGTGRADGSTAWRCRGRAKRAEQPAMGGDHYRTGELSSPRRRELSALYDVMSG